MSDAGNKLQHVSDTALVVAALRAIETARADGLVRDPFAARLAGKRGEALTAAVPRSEWRSLVVLGLRSRFVDELVTAAIAEHAVQTVVNLGAGLDSRPWRLELPPNLRWIEVDFPDILNYKAETLATETPRCQLERRFADLADAAGRQSVFAAANGSAGLMITEGLLMYLPPETVEAFAKDAPGGIRYWLLDVVSQDLLRRTHNDDWQNVEKLRAKNYLKGAEILEVARRHGWESIAHRTYARDGVAVASDRIMALGSSEAIAGQIEALAADPSGVYLFGR